MSFRNVFRLEGKLEKWFPGHMVKGLNTLRKKLTSIDCLIEIHDARIPLTGRNRDFRTYLTVAKPHILLLNKVDLADTSNAEEVRQHLKGQGINQIIYTSVNQSIRQSNFHQILPAVIKEVESSDRHNRASAPDINVAVIGIPNVGKSTLINRLRQQKMETRGSLKVGKQAGVTVAVMEKICICRDPLIYLIDTPGILEPKVNNIQEYMRVALMSSMSDNVVGIRNIADYGLFWLNRNGIISYVDFYGLEKPTDSIVDFLSQICIKQKFITKFRHPETQKIVPRPDLDAAATNFVQEFRRGSFGRFMLDKDVLNKTRHNFNEDFFEDCNRAV